MDGKPFEWIADGDSRLGPLLEVILEGRYVWVPFCRIKRVNIERPADLRDLVWAPAQFVWTNGGEASATFPVVIPKPKIIRWRTSARPEDDWVEHEAASASGWASVFSSRTPATIPCLNAAPLIWRRSLDLPSTM